MSRLLALDGGQCAKTQPLWWRAPERYFDNSKGRSRMRKMIISRLFPLFCDIKTILPSESSPFFINFHSSITAPTRFPSFLPESRLILATRLPLFQIFIGLPYLFKLPVTLSFNQGDTSSYPKKAPLDIMLVSNIFALLGLASYAHANGISLAMGTRINVGVSTSITAKASVSERNSCSSPGDFFTQLLDNPLCSSPHTRTT